MLPILATAALALAAPIPKDQPVKPDAVTERQIALLHDNRVQRELALTAEKRIVLIDHFEAADEEYRHFLAVLYPPSSAELTKDQSDAKRKEQSDFAERWRKESRTVVAGNLTPAQHARLRELERRFLSLFAFQVPEVAAELKLTPDQLKVVGKAVAEYREKYAEEYDSRKKPTSLSPFELAKPYLKTIDVALNEAQRTRWKELLGGEPKIATPDTAKARETLDTAVRRAREFIPK